jgi:SET domain-containing protein
MMAVKTYLAASKIHGVGVFAAEKIEPGTVVWYFDHRIDRLYELTDDIKLPKVFWEFLLSHAYVDRRFRKWVLCGDNAKYINHADRPNVLADGDVDKAAQVILPGDEITNNYKVFDDREQLFLLGAPPE